VTAQGLALTLKDIAADPGNVAAVKTTKEGPLSASGRLRARKKR
jgi:hypothetical protein